jgi:hypothetical protein
VCRKTTLKCFVSQDGDAWWFPAMTETGPSEHRKRFDRRLAGKMQVQVNFYASRLRICRNHSITVKYIRRSTDSKLRVGCFSLGFHRAMH